MAFSTRTSLFFFFTALVLLSTQIHARESYFFGKFHRENAPKDTNPNNVHPLETSEKTTVEEQSIPNKNEQEQDPSFVPESENGYGLYGHETTYNDNKEEFNKNNKYDEKVNGETFSTPSLSETEESYNNKYDEQYPKKTEQSFDRNGYNNDVFTNNNKYEEKYPKKTEQRYENNVYNNEEFNNNNKKYDENVKEESYSENNEDKGNFYNSNAYGTELERETPYKGYSHNLEKQGMSDTRFMEKGNYYYDLYNDRNHGHYYKKSHQKSPSGYYTSPTTDNNNNYEQAYSYNNNNNEEEKTFKDTYNSKWEKNMMNEQPEEFVEEQGNDFKP
ncbi:hypothetical protein AALP_AA1G293300 [Arabis alpina]|uniref:Protein E6 n=1 Tax=Arabis alpina TaxID=50452 RepID=A0A087HRG2_ARAAL|nr:hypothetical protein AALP_AA1G293300 [Arabis alpina]